MDTSLGALCEFRYFLGVICILTDSEISVSLQQQQKQF